MEVVQVKKLRIDGGEDQEKVNEFLASLPAKDVLNVNFAIDSNNDARDVHVIVVTYKTIKDPA